MFAARCQINYGCGVSTLQTYAVHCTDQQRKAVHHMLLLDVLGSAGPPTCHNAEGNTSMSESAQTQVARVMRRLQLRTASGRRRINCSQYSPPILYHALTARELRACMVMSALTRHCERGGLHSRNWTTGHFTTSQSQSYLFTSGILKEIFSQMCHFGSL